MFLSVFTYLFIAELPKAVNKLNFIQRNKCDISYTLSVGDKFIPSYILSHLSLPELLPGRYYSHFTNFTFIISTQTKFLAQDHTANKGQHWDLHPMSDAQIPRPSSPKSKTSQ